MNPIIKIVKNKKIIADILGVHQNCLASLSKGEDYRCEIAEKYAHNAFFVAAESENKIVGFCAFYANDYSTRTAYISMIAVLPEYRKQQIGQILLNETFVISKNAGMNSIKLEVRRSNTNAISFYQKNKFEFVEVSKEKGTQYMRREL